MRRTTRSTRRAGSAALTAALALASWTLSSCEATGVRQCLDLAGEKEHEAAAELCGQVFDAGGDPRAGAAAARAHGGLANRHLSGGDRDGAVAEYERSTELARAAGDHAQAARSLYGLFYTAHGNADYRQALLWADESAAEAELAGDEELLATARQALAAVYYDLGDLEGAERTLEAARELDDPGGEVYLLSLLGIVRLDQGRPALARAVIEEALAKAGEREEKFFRSAHLNLVRAALELGEAETAERHLAKAWEHAEPDGRSRTALLYYQATLEHRRGDLPAAAATLTKAIADEPSRDWLWQLEHLRGLVARARGETGTAREAFEASAAAVEELRGSLGSDELKAWLLDKKRRPFEALFRLEAEAGRAAAALQVVERAKARSFLDAFIRPAEGARGPAASATADRAEAVGAILAAMRASPVVTPRPLGEVLRDLGDRHVLTYFEAEGELWLLALAGGRVTARRLATSVEEVEKSVSRFLADPDGPEPAAALGKRLLPSDVLPAPGEPLYLVTDGVLGRLAFAALRPAGRYLVEDHAVSYVPGLNALAALENRRRPPAHAAVVLGDPRGDLPGAGREAREVARRLDTPARTGDEATLEAFATAARASVLHMATHTGLGPRGPWLALADADVDAAAIVGRGIGPRLVVLAGCASAARRGRGLWGSLGAAFLAAGSDGVLAALWSIEDEAARRFVTRFYDEGGAQAAAFALARTQRSFIAAGEPPSSWAPFVFFGSDRRGLL